MAWTSTYWEQDDSVYSGFPYARYSKPIDFFDYSLVEIPFKINSDLFQGFPYTSIPPVFSASLSYQNFRETDGYFYDFPYTQPTDKFMSSKTFQWLTQDDNQFEGFPLGFNMEPFQLGAFRGCHSITELSVPATVTKLGKYAFKDCGIETLTIAPDCSFYNTTFTLGMNIQFWAVTDFTIVSEPTKKEYLVGEEFDPTGLKLRATITDDKQSITREIVNNYTLSGFDSSEVGEYDVYVIFDGVSYLLPSKYIVTEPEPEPETQGE